jgi:antitoxin MazE
MELQVNRWGNSLAVRLPQELVKQLGLQEGDRIQAEALGLSRLGLAVDAQALEKRRHWLRSVAKLHETMPVTQPVSKEDMSQY